MKLAFSTLGCPNWDLDQILDCAVECGYSGLEFRGYLDQVDLRNSPLFSKAHLPVLKQRLASAGIKPVVVASSAQLCQVDKARREATLSELADYCLIAQQLGAPLVRVFGGNPPEGATEAEALEAAQLTLRQAEVFAASYKVRLALETHDFFVTGKRVGAVLAAGNPEASCALWDMHHPWRAGESLEASWDYLGSRLGHAHLKDSRLLPDGTVQLCLTGMGDIPLAPFLELTLKRGYQGYYSFEWEKRWQQQLEEPEVALPQFAETLRSYLASLNQGGLS